LTQEERRNLAGERTVPRRHSLSYLITQHCNSPWLQVLGEIKRELADLQRSGMHAANTPPRRFHTPARPHQPPMAAKTGA
jgi:hypothetical protein